MEALGAKPANDGDRNVQRPGGTPLEQLGVQQRIKVTGQRLNGCILGRSCVLKIILNRLP